MNIYTTVEVFVEKGDALLQRFLVAKVNTTGLVHGLSLSCCHCANIYQVP